MTTFTPEVAHLLSSAPAVFPLERKAFQAHQQAKRLVAEDPKNLFGAGPHPQAALAGLLLRMECWTESHQIAQDVESIEGAYWHGIIHRIEPDSFNAGYWFKRVGSHPIFPGLRDRAVGLLEAAGLPDWQLKDRWDPLLFVEWCGEARQLGSNFEAVALQIQATEWQMLFDWCTGAT